MAESQEGCQAGRPNRIASCEPCGLSKLACDHRRPVCSRCAKKGMFDECIYRKDPLKRTRGVAASGSTHTPYQTAITPQLPRNRVYKDGPVLHRTLASDPGSSQSTLRLKLYRNPGFQGSSSLNTIINGIERVPNHQSSNSGTPSVGWFGDDANRDQEWMSSDTTPMAWKADIVEECLAVFDQFIALLSIGSIQQILNEWDKQGLQAHLGSFLVQPVFSSMSDMLSTIQQAPDRLCTLLAWCRRLFTASNRSLKVDGQISMQDFTNQFTGPSLRWDSVGLILTLTG